MTLPAVPYNPDNIFAKILRGEIPAHTVYEDEKALAFLDIMPRASGHTLVIPKAPARNILDVDTGDLAHVMAVAQKIARAAMTAFEADGITLQQFSEEAGGQAVFHLHVHVIPRRNRQSMLPPASHTESPETLRRNAEALRRALAARA